MNRIVSIYERYKDRDGKRYFVPATYIGKARLAHDFAFLISSCASNRLVKR